MHAALCLTTLHSSHGANSNGPPHIPINSNTKRHQVGLLSCCTPIRPGDGALGSSTATEWNLLGIPLGDSTHVVSLYADDLLIYIRNIERGADEVTQALHLFHNMSGLKVNLQKHCIFSFLPSASECRLVMGGTPLKW